MLADRIVLSGSIGPEVVREPMTLLRALMVHLRRDESLAEFRKQIKDLTLTDRIELAVAFEHEFNVEIVRSIPGLEPLT